MNKKQILIGAAMLSLFASGNLVAKKGEADAQVKGECTQANECAGKGTCKGYQGEAKAAHECKGHNACNHNVMSDVTKKECKKMKGTFTKSA